jgi:hypothetical protein
MFAKAISAPYALVLEACNRHDASLSSGPTGYSRIRGEDLLQTVATCYGQDFQDLRRVTWSWDPRKVALPSWPNVRDFSNR